MTERETVKFAEVHLGELFIADGVRYRKVTPFGTGQNAVEILGRYREAYFPSDWEVEREEQHEDMRMRTKRA